MSGSTRRPGSRSATATLRHEECRVAELRSRVLCHVRRPGREQHLPPYHRPSHDGQQRGRGRRPQLHDRHALHGIALDDGWPSGLPRCRHWHEPVRGQRRKRVRHGHLPRDRQPRHALPQSTDRHRGDQDRQHDPREHLRLQPLRQRHRQRSGYAGPSPRVRVLAVVVARPSQSVDLRPGILRRARVDPRIPAVRSGRRQHRASVGNFDYATRQARWDTAEVPKDVAVPASRALPASLFLAARPRWWGTIAWPAIGPDVTGGQDPAGHAHKIPAEVCFETTARQADGTLRFDAAACYGGSRTSLIGR